LRYASDNAEIEFDGTVQLWRMGITRYAIVGIRVEGSSIPTYDRIGGRRRCTNDREMPVNSSSIVDPTGVACRSSWSGRVRSIEISLCTRTKPSLVARNRDGCVSIVKREPDVTDVLTYAYYLRVRQVVRQCDDQMVRAVKRPRGRDV